MRESLDTDKLEVTEEHRQMVRAIYDTIIPIKFRWGGHGFLKVRKDTTV